MAEHRFESKIKRATDSEQPAEKSLADRVLGYEHPDSAYFDDNAQKIRKQWERPYGIPLSEHNSSFFITGPEYFAEPIAKMKEDVANGILLDLGCGGEPVVGVAGLFGIKDVVGIDLGVGQADQEPGTYRENQWDGIHTLEINEDILRGISHIQSDSIDVVHMRGLDVFVGDVDILKREIQRVLKPNSYIIDDQNGELLRAMDADYELFFNNLYLHIWQKKIEPKKKTLETKDDATELGIDFEGVQEIIDTMGDTWANGGAQSDFRERLAEHILAHPESYPETYYQYATEHLKSLHKKRVGRIAFGIQGHTATDGSTFTLEQLRTMENPTAVKTLFPEQWQADVVLKSESRTSEQRLNEMNEYFPGKQKENAFIVKRLEDLSWVFSHGLKLTAALEGSRYIPASVRVGRSAKEIVYAISDKKTPAARTSILPFDPANSKDTRDFMSGDQSRIEREEKSLQYIGYIRFVDDGTKRAVFFEYIDPEQKDPDLEKVIVPFMKEVEAEYVERQYDGMVLDMAI